MAAANELFDLVPDVVFFVKDLQGQYVSASRTLVERCGLCSKSELIGKKATEVFPDPIGQRYWEQDLWVISGGRRLLNELELHLYVNGQKGWALTSKIPIFAPNRTVVGLVGISKDLHISESRGPNFPQLAKTIRHIQSHFHEALRIEGLAEMASVSVYRFENQIKKIFQMTAGQFITQTRIEAACQLLTNSAKPLSEIAVECGFYDQSAFSRQFKASAKLTPGKYRQMAKTRNTYGADHPANRLKIAR